MAIVGANVTPNERLAPRLSRVCGNRNTRPSTEAEETPLGDVVGKKNAIDLAVIRCFRQAQSLVATPQTYEEMLKY